MKKSHLVLSLSAALLLSACGTSPKSTAHLGDRAEPEVAVPKEVSPPPPPAPPKESPKDPVTQEAVIGEVEQLKNLHVYNNNIPHVAVIYKIPKKSAAVDEQFLSNKFHSEWFPNFTKKTVFSWEPVSISLDNQNTVHLLDAGVIKHYAERNEHTLWGAVNDAAIDKDHYFLTAQGISPTIEPEVPTSGEFTYKGSAFHLLDDPNNRDPQRIVKGEANFKADFSEKKEIRGVISFADNAHQPVMLGGKIDGRAFSGNVDGTDLIGGFYGEHASEITGAYKGAADNKHFYGVFGAAKQP